MWHLKVPRILHIYFGGNKLIYMRYLTVKSFMRLNPDWEVYFWYPLKPFKGKSWGIEPGDQEINYNRCKDYLPELMRMNIKKMPVDFESLGFSPSVAEVHKNDFIRFNVLGLNGGVWSDLDIIFTRPLCELDVNKPENKDIETFVCIGDYGHSTGFLMSSKENEFFKVLSNLLKNEYHKREYQCWGPDLLNKHFRTIEKIGKISPVVNLGMDTVYAHDCHHMKELLANVPKRFTDHSIGCHWYGGNSVWGKFINETKGGVENLSDNIISDLIRGE